MDDLPARYYWRYYVLVHDNLHFVYDLRNILASTHGVLVYITLHASNHQYVIMARDYSQNNNWDDFQDTNIKH